ncbi:MAG: restriction endonuclease subunit S, partial [Gammaproteobacteria bacterium]
MSDPSIGPSIPDGWRSLPLSEVASEKIVYGIVQAGPHDPDGVPYLKSSDVGEAIATADLQRTTPEIHAKFGRSKVVPGNIVISLRGNTGATSVVPPDLPMANLTQGTARIAVAKEHHSVFVRQQIASASTQRLIQAATKGSTFVEITLDDPRKVEILCPPQQEQAQIAVILSTWDRAIETVEALIANAHEQKSALMQALLTGRKRLPGFSGVWAERTLDTIFEFIKGQGLAKDDVIPNGAYPCILYGELYTRYPEVIGEVIGRTNADEGTKSCTGDLLVPASTTTSGIDLANATALLQSDVRLSGDINILRPRDAAQSAPFFAYLLTHAKR